jgi:transposase
MEEVVTVGLDIAKSVFQVHGVDAAGAVVLQRRLMRSKLIAFFEKLPRCRVGIEACATAHYWGRRLGELGHEVRLMPPSYVKPYVKRQKNDAADAEAICEAVGRPNMRFVETKTPEQQGCLTIHRTRHLFIRQQTSVINAIRAHLAEFGIVAPVGRRGVDQLLAVVSDTSDKRLSTQRQCFINRRTMPPARLTKGRETRSVNGRIWSDAISVGFCGHADGQRGPLRVIHVGSVLSAFEALRT